MSDGAFQQNADGSWTPAEPIGWMEEHNWLQRLVFRVRGIEHCNDREGQPRVPVVMTMAGKYPTMAGSPSCNWGRGVPVIKDVIPCPSKAVMSVTMTVEEGHPFSGVVFTLCEEHLIQVAKIARNE